MSKTFQLVDNYSGRKIVPNLEEVASLDDLRSFLEALHELWRRDNEAGHLVDNEIREHVLRLIASGKRGASALAREVLITSTWRDVDRWYA